MTASAVAALLLAVATLIAPGRAVVRVRLAALTKQGDPDRAAPSTANRLGGVARPLVVAVSVGSVPVVSAGWPAGALFGLLLGGATFIATQRFLRRREQRGDGAVDPLLLASSWDLLAACLRGGLPVPAAVAAIAADIPGAAGPALRHTAELIALGADPVAAWVPALDHPATVQLARGARRTARSGAALAGVAETLATEVRAGADDLAEARAQRAAVAVTGPLGLCFLPAFICLGVVPVVIGLATRLMATL
ncbi:MAG TPA: type II secretion system F family protein [Pseudonocardiaceae bacterium]|jgi:pilus assembly protein TadC|nr:type II secretion system F family protein [Pseudonocardiaceae bacterium]